MMHPSHNVPPDSYDPAAPQTEKPEIPAPSSTFQITLYNPGKDSLHGKIKYLIDKAEKSFQGLDMGTIQEFIEAKLPKNTESGGSMVQVSNVEKNPERPKPERGEPPKADSTTYVENNLHISGSEIVFPKEFGRIYEMEPLILVFSLREDLGRLPASNTAKVSILGKKLGSFTHFSLNPVYRIPIEGGRIEIHISPQYLEVGTYFFAITLEIEDTNSFGPHILETKIMVPIGAVNSPEVRAS